MKKLFLIVLLALGVSGCSTGIRQPNTAVPEGATITLIGEVDGVKIYSILWGGYSSRLYVSKDGQIAASQH